MLIRKQDIPVLMLYCMGYSTMRTLLARLRRQPLTRFLAFHDIPPASEAGFRAKLCFLKRRTNVVSLDDYFAGHLSLNRLNIVITFDDGYKSWIAKAVPALRQLSLPAVFFVSSGFLSLSQPAESEFIRSRLKTGTRTTGSLTKEDLRKIAEEGFTIGGHTLNHVNLREVRDRCEASREIREDKERLEAITGRTVRYFAYPFGADKHAEIDLIDVLRDAQYAGAVTTAPGFNSGGSAPYSLKRELTDAGMPLRVFKARVYGNCDGVTSMKTAARAVFGLRRDLPAQR